LVRLTQAGERVCGELLAEQRAALADLLAELPRDDQRHLLQVLESLCAVLARNPNCNPAGRGRTSRRAKRGRAPHRPSVRR
jgi:hypothetical protein